MYRWSSIIGIIAMCQFCLCAVTEAGTGTLDITETVKALRQIKLPGDDPTVPPEIRPLLTKLKHQLRDLITLTLNSHALKSANLEDVRKALVTELGKQGVDSGKQDIVDVWPDQVDQSFTYGDVYQVAIRKIEDHPDLIAATTTIGVCCGNDTSLYVYQRTNEEWKLLIAQETNGYKDVGGAQGSFGYAVSPPSKDGQFFVVTKDVNPWCTSNWQSIHYKVLRPNKVPYESKVLLKQTDSIYLGKFGEGIIQIEPTGFTLEFEGGQNLDSGVLTRRHIASYSVKGNEVRRVPPFAREPESFLDEWFDLPWVEASKWVLPSAVTTLHAIHAKIHTDRSGSYNISTSFIFDPPACRIECGQWQIGIEFEPSEGKRLPVGVPKEAYFTIIEKKNSYFLKGVSALSQSRCRFQKAEACAQKACSE